MQEQLRAAHTVGANPGGLRRRYVSVRSSMREEARLQRVVGKNQLGGSAAPRGHGAPLVSQHEEEQAMRRKSNVEAMPTTSHPLFPRHVGVKIDNIIIFRWLPNGKKERCPKIWKGTEIVSWDQIRDLYGGECTYQVVAQCSKTHRFQAFSDRNDITGAPRKTFSGELVTTDLQEQPPREEPAFITTHGGHPLFPEAEIAADLRIHVLVRRPDGSWEVRGRAWNGSELRSWMQIQDIHGRDNTYRLLAEYAATGELLTWSEATFRASPRASSLQTRRMS